MSNCNSCRIYSGMKQMGVKAIDRRISKGRKKKVRRMHRAYSNDGCERKRAGSLSPVFRTSKSELLNYGDIFL